jgi:hypothetical protein
MKNLVNTVKALTLSLALGTTSVMSMTDGERYLITAALPYVQKVLENTAACEEGGGAGSQRIGRKLANYYTGVLTQLFAIEDRDVLAAQIAGLGEQSSVYYAKLKEVNKRFAVPAMYKPNEYMMAVVSDHLMTIEEKFNDGVKAEALPTDNSLFTTQYP